MKKSLCPCSQEGEIQFEELFNNMDEAVAVYDILDNGKKIIINNLNKSAEKLEKVKKENVIGKRVEDVFKGVKKFGLYKIFLQVWKTGKSMKHPISFYNDNHRQGWRENFVFKLPSGKVIAIYSDVTQRKEIEEEYKNVSEKANDGIAIIQKGIIKYVNPALARMYNDSLKNMINHRFIQFIAPSERKKVEQAYRNRMLGKKFPSRYESMLLRKDKSHICVELNAGVIPYRGAQADLVIVRDITERKKSELALKNEKEKLKSIFLGFPIPAMVLNSEHKIVQWNQAMEELTGIESSKAIGTTNQWKAFYPIKRPTLADLLINNRIRDLPKFYGSKAHQRWFGNRQVEYKPSKLIPNAYECVAFFPSLKSSGRWLRFTSAQVRDASGRIIGAIETMEDITQQKKVEDELKTAKENVEKQVEERTRELKEAQEKYRLLYTSSKDAIMTLAPPNWKFIIGNPTTLEMFNVPSEKLFTSLNPWILSPEKQPDGQLSRVKAKEMVDAAMKTGRNYFEWMHKRYNGENFPATVLLSRVQEEGKSYLQATVRDITEKKKAEMELNEAYEKLKDIDKLKSRFLTITSHELKTPLTPAMIQLQMLLEGDFGELNSDQKQSFEIILRNIERLGKLIEDILEISRIESEGFQLNFEKVQLDEIISSVMKSMNPVAENKGLLPISYQHDKLPRILADKKRITEVVVNLIDNAIKFTNKGKITIKAKKHQDHILVEVSDTGKGIPKESFDKIFEPFFQVEPTLTREHNGTGLGLSICKSIVKQHQGEMWFESEIGKGTTFYFTLPLKQKTASKN